MSMVHDNIIKSYLVDIENRKLKLFTTYHYNENHYEETTVTFNGYVTHSFRHVIYSNIILDIIECSVENFLKYSKKEVLDGKNYTWPISFKDLNDFKSSIKKDSLKIFDIYSALGLNGWIIAKEMIIDVKEINKADTNV